MSRSFTSLTLGSISQFNHSLSLSCDGFLDAKLKNLSLSRATKILTEQGFYAFWNWFDHTAWYPLGRVVGGTIYPGLMVTSGLIWNMFRLLNVSLSSLYLHFSPFCYSFTHSCLLWLQFKTDPR